MFHPSSSVSTLKSTLTLRLPRPLVEDVQGESGGKRLGLQRRRTMRVERRKRSDHVSGLICNSVPIASILLSQSLRIRDLIRLLQHAKGPIVQGGRCVHHSQNARGIYHNAVSPREPSTRHEDNPSFPRNFAIGSSATSRDLL